MKKKLKIILIIILVLAVLLAVALLRNGSFPGIYTYPDSARYTSGGGSVTGAVTAIDLDWLDGTVSIARHNGEGILLSETASRDLGRDAQLHWWLDNGTLNVKYASSGYFTREQLNKHLTVLLPADLMPDSLELDVVSSAVSLENISTGKLLINSVSGSMDMTLDTVNQLAINTVSGTAKSHAVQARSVNISTVSGNLDLRFTYEPEQLNVDSVSANTTISLPAGAGFTASFDSVSGLLDGTLPMTRQDNHYVCGDGRCPIKLHSVSGSFSLNELP